MKRRRLSTRTDLELYRLSSELSQLRSEMKGESKGHASIFSNPTWLAILGALVTFATGVWQLQANRQLEREKLRSTLIQEASKSGNPETTLTNLQFLVKAHLIDDEQGAIASLKLEDVPSFTLSDARPLSSRELLEQFGDPKLVSKQEGDGALAFATPDDAWVKENLVHVDLPALVGVPGFPSSGRIRFHKKAAPHLQAAIAEIAQKGLIGKIKSYDGAWVPRTVRGSTRYSTHAFGIAIDINSRYHPIGREPLTAEQEGSNVELALIFERHGFYWGGRFTRP